MTNDQQTKTAGRIIDMTREINAPVEAVWNALTDAKELERWFPLHASVKEGIMEWSWGSKVDWRLEVEESKEGKYLRLGYGEESPALVMDEPHRLAVEFFLEAQGGKTMLRIVHTGFGGSKDWDELYDGVRRGWDTESISLKHYLENHAGKDRLVAFAKKKSGKSREEIWKILTENGIATIGENYVYSTPLEEDYEGKLLYFHQPQDLVGTLNNLNNALFRLMLDRSKPEGPITVWAWVAAYDVPEEKIKAVEAAWQQKLDALLG